MSERTLEGWIYDAYAEHDGIRVWILDREGGSHALLDPWRPCLYLEAAPGRLERALGLLRSRAHPVATRPVERVELFSGRARPVLEVRVPASARDALVRELSRLDVALHNADIHPVQAWHYERGHFPLALCSFLHQDGRVLEHELRDDPWAVDYELPPLRGAHLALAGSESAGAVDPNHAPRGSLVFRMDGRACEFEGPLEEQLDSLAERLREWDPDVLTTDWGDSWLLPTLDRLAAASGRRLPWSRDPARNMAGKGGKSFYTYGRAVYQNGIRYLFGRWHLDLRNSFALRECGLDGLIETARVARIPVQRAARCTIGTALTSMQMNQAWTDGVLVPARKSQAEDFRGADELLDADKGGLVYEPETGWHGEVAEYDFTSMYPTMMDRHNISPETVNCACCEGEPVPGTAHRTCRRRRGIVPKVVAPILAKRAEYKRLARLGGPRAESFKRRAAAHKWTLVCVFGYLGFRNARFGKIEAHECVNAWGRETLLRAKEAAEARGFRMLHALVDSLWLEGRAGADYEALRRAIEEEAGCPVGLEGVYRWLRFCPSRRDPRAGVPARYFGAFQDGELNFRGLALRRRDTPPLLKSMQSELLRRLAREPDLAGARAARGDLEEIVEEYRARLREGRVKAEELALTFNLSKEPAEYVRGTHSALAARKLAACGLRLRPGETVRYVIASAEDEVADWRVVPLALLEGPLEYDAGRYLELLERAARELLQGL